MQRATWRQRFGYWFDNTMARGTWALVGWLAVLSLVLIVSFSLIIVLTGIAPTGGDPAAAPPFYQVMWNSFMHSLDSGAIGGDQAEWPYLAAMLGVTLGGIFIVSTLIGVLSSGIESKLEDLRKGRSRVLETGHTLILGWSDAVYTIVSELVIANANQRRPRIVILADQDKVEMDDAIRTKVGSTGTTRVICRSGHPIDLDDLALANPQGARAIIVLAPLGDDPDSQVIKTILAITNNPQRRAEPYHIVAEIRDTRNLPAARVVGKDEATYIEVDNTIARLIAQTSRQNGLSSVYTELFDFGGDEIYFQTEPALAGRTFGESLAAYPKCSLIGLRGADGVVRLLPPLDTTLAAGDALIVIAADDDMIRNPAIPAGVVDEAALAGQRTSVATPEGLLLLGWNRRAPAIVRELDSYVAPGSTLTVVADTPDAAAAIAIQQPTLQHLAITVSEADTTDREVLDGLNVGQYRHIIVLCYSDTLDVQRADSRTLVTLLHLRDIEARSEGDFSIVSEMLDDRNRALAEVTKADDFVVSDKLISLMMSQIAENRHLAAVFADLLDPEGAEIYLKPAGDYVKLGQAVNFYTVIEAARQAGEIAFGYRLAAGPTGPAVVVNPDKTARVTFATADRIVVLAD
jgi:voltage-gated potassium channel Kch